MSNNTDNVIIVPIDVQAICIGSEDANKSSFVQRDVDFSLLPKRDGNQIFNDYAYISENIESTPFSSDRIALPKGIHLHWALPDALTNGVVNETVAKNRFQTYFGEEDGNEIWKELLERQWLILSDDDLESAHFNEISLLSASSQNLSEAFLGKQEEIKRFLEDQEIQFYNVPNRWLVSRIVDGKQTASWVVESDFLSSNDYDDQGNRRNNTTVLHTLEGTEKRYCYLGEKFDIRIWSNDIAEAKYYPNLTVKGSGEQEFASFYPNCSTVFGFHDDLSDITTTDATVTYQVSGWYSNKKKDSTDPFQKTDQPKALLEEFNWETSLEDVKNTLYAGTATQIKWAQDRNYVEKPENKNIQVAFADNEKEALNALVTDGHLQHFMTAWLMGIHDYLDVPGGIFKVDKEIHASRFSSDSSGILWNVIDQRTDETTPALPNAPNKQDRLSSDVVNALENINQIQEQINRTNAKIISLRERIFNDWCKYLIRKYDANYFSDVEDLLKSVEGATEDQISETAIREFIEQVDLIALQNTLNKIHNSEGPSGDDLTTQLNTAKTQLESAVTTLNSTGNRKYAINNVPAPVYYQSNDPVVLLRDTDSNGWQYAGSRNQVKIDSEDLPCRIPDDVIKEMTAVPNVSAILSNPDLPFIDTLNRLLREAFVFNQYTYATLENMLKQEHMYSGTLPPHIAVTEWKGENPFLVMQMHWRTYFSGLKKGRDTDGSYSSTFINDSFSFTKNSKELQISSDLLTNDHFSDHFDEEQTLTGKSILTPNVTVVARHQMMQNMKENVDDEQLHDRLSSLKSKFEASQGSILAQELSGFNEALVMNKHGFQLPVDNPIAAAFDQNFAHQIGTGVSEENYKSPLPQNQYHPIRTGLVKVDAIRIVDCFGRFKDVDVSHITYSDELHLKNTVVSYNAFLPPRITQSSRLVARYLGADATNTITYSGENPVCGWLISNNLENSLMFYHTDGSLLGTLRYLSEDLRPEIHEAAVLWQSPEGKAAVSIDEATKKANKHFKDYIKSLSELQAFEFEQLLENIADRQMNMNSTFNKGIVHLMGNPIAFVRANIELQLNGLPEINESWKALLNDVVTNTTERSIDEFDEVGFPVQIGTSDQRNDGVYTYHYETSATSIKASNTEGSDITVSMLVNPSLPIHINTGILPEQKLQIPQQYYEDALRNISATFLTAPILVNEDDLKMPLSKVDGWEWSFLQKQGKDWLALEDKIADASNEATYSASQRKIVEGWLQLKKKKNN